MSVYTGVQNAYGCANLQNSTRAYEGMRRPCVTSYPPEKVPDTSIWKIYSSTIYVPYNSLQKTYERKNENPYAWTQPKE